MGSGEGADEVIVSLSFRSENLESPVREMGEHEIRRSGRQHGSGAIASETSLHEVEHARNGHKWSSSRLSRFKNGEMIAMANEDATEQPRGQQSFEVRSARIHLFSRRGEKRYCLQL